ncbi:hypothetical protein A1OE_1312 [Candidatus Endolissoclinum faulkneri L2]|uniref:Uncharacterized protein n=1 Tax=Candidatus Endolissoclinum faulkneri L2 TaxID=1193729 RepID=K7YIQ6_9PROT|nr:hypothetical protein A1OE_1312 [Candidatus Endolissoclinum faulkneri L2]
MSLRQSKTNLKAFSNVVDDWHQAPHAKYSSIYCRFDDISFTFLMMNYAN